MKPKTSSAVKVKDGNKAWSLSVPEQLDQRLRDFLYDPSRGYVPQGALSKFVAEAVEEKLSRVEAIDLSLEL
ncbi:MAG: ribbon-helix-helix domain protein [Siphoviridae sp. ct7UA22]|nr:MAG: ribbon-helix-helix domain protein [Siphoviridae sp. ct7UA22]